MLRRALLLASATIYTQVAYGVDYRYWPELTDEQKQIVTSVIVNTTNAYMAAKPESPLYCPPKTLRFTNDQLISIVDESVQREPHLKFIDVETILTLALSKLFPC